MKMYRKLKIQPSKPVIVIEHFHNNVGYRLGSIMTEFEGKKVYETVRVQDCVTRRKSGRNV